MQSKLCVYIDISVRGIKVKNRIKELRKEHKLSQGELADLVGTTRQTITSIEVGKYTASLPLKAKHELQKYTTIWAFVGIYSGLILTANGLGYLTKSYTDSNFADFMNGFYTGLFIVIGMVALYNVGKNYKAMKNERDLLRLYNEMHDERNRQIELLSKGQAFMIAEDLLLVIALISSFFNSYLFAGIIIAVIVFAVTGVICKVYYKRTYTGEE